MSMKIVIVGAGFGGLLTARHLQRLLPRSATAEVTLLGEENFFLFTPMLAEVVSGEVEPAHIVTPVRSFLADERFRFHQASVTHIDLESKIVTAICEKSHCLLLDYDYLVLATGSKPSVPELQGEEPWLFSLGSLSDAMGLHNQVLDMFEHADMLDSRDAERSRMLTIVIAGGGYAGVEVAAAIEELAFSTLLGQYRSIRAEDVRIVLAHGGERILPELGEELAAYVYALLSRRNIDIRLGTAVSLPGQQFVRLDEESFPCGTVVWTAGSRPSQLAGELPLDKDSRGRVVVDERGVSASFDNVFALGDCASQPGPGDSHYPPTAQIAIRQARIVAENVAASAYSRRLRPFVYYSQGKVVPLGHHAGAAILWGLRLRGIAAWWLSRSLYLLRLPTWGNRIRVVLDWTLDLIFPPATNRITLR